jgi:hypothetical protein
MTVFSHTHVVVKDAPPPTQTQSVGHLYGIPASYKTFVPDYAPNAEDEEEEEEVETKVVRRGRRPKPKANEQAETK